LLTPFLVCYDVSCHIHFLEEDRPLNTRLPVRWRFQSRRDSLENQKKPVQAESKQPKRKQRKMGKIEQVYKLHQKGSSVKQIAEKMKLGERVVRSYVWRSANPEKYDALLRRYREKKKAKLKEANMPEEKAS
jgi:hypothetical protein